MSRPTLLIGYGEFGRAALQRLLHQSALRGVLNWKQFQHGGVGSAERQLQDLALLALNDPFEQRVDGLKLAGDKGVPQFLRDLYRQIRELPAKTEQTPEAAAGFARMIAGDLLARTDMTPKQDALALGLDLIVLAHPESQETIAQLDLVLEAILESLSSLPYFQVGVQGAENLACIEILDFDSFWERDAQRGTPSEADRLRASVRSSVEGWELRRNERKAAVGRCYLVDAYTDAGQRSPAMRMDEITLFMELLLFEDLRTKQPELYQQRSLQQPITATFGIRLLEESTMFLSRTAAATFGRRWLDALIGDTDACPGHIATHTRDALRPYRPKDMIAQLNDERLDAAFDQRREGIIGRLSQLSGIEQKDWPERLRQGFEAERLQLEQHLNGIAWELIINLKESLLKEHDTRIAEAIDQDLHHGNEPASLRLVLAEVNGLRRELSRQPEETLQEAEATDPLESLRKMHRRYRRELDDWLAHHGNGLQWFWPLFSFLLAIGLAPLVTDVLLAIPEPKDPGRLRDFVKFLIDDLADQPLLWTGLFGIGIWIISATMVQRLIGDRIKRAQDFFSHRKTGRFVQRIRALGDVLRLTVLERARRNMRSGLASDVVKTLSRIEEHLCEREREMGWLRIQLKEFLNWQTRPSNAVRKWIDGDLATMMDANPLTRICFQQPDLQRPFDGWNNHYCDAFLDPIRFIDLLSKQYVEHHERRVAERNSNDEQNERLEELQAFVAGCNLHLSCRFMADEGVTTQNNLCVTTERWHNLNGMANLLNQSLGITTNGIHSGTDRARVYLLATQFGITARNLELPAR